MAGKSPLREYVFSHFLEHINVTLLRLPRSVLKELSEFIDDQEESLIPGTAGRLGGSLQGRDDAARIHRLALYRPLERVVYLLLN